MQAPCADTDTVATAAAAAEDVLRLNTIEFSGDDYQKACMEYQPYEYFR
jgi:hypothetical protein